MATQKTQSPFHQLRVLITAGATREPLDDVRFISNRSSGALGLELAHAADRAGLHTTLALGKSVQNPNTMGLEVIRFEQTSDLRELLNDRMPQTDILVMAAAVADHTPRQRHPGKLSRSGEARITLELIATPDLLAEVSAHARRDQLLVGFALEPEDSLIASAQRKLESKGVDLIIANPLETMESGSIRATLVAAPPTVPYVEQPGNTMTKPEFAAWLWPILLACHRQKAE